LPLTLTPDKKLSLLFKKKFKNTTRNYIQFCVYLYFCFVLPRAKRYTVWSSEKNDFFRKVPAKTEGFLLKRQTILAGTVCQFVSIAVTIKVVL